MPVFNYVHLTLEHLTHPVAAGILIGLVMSLNLVLCLAGQRLYRVVILIYSVALVSGVLAVLLHVLTGNWIVAMLGVVPGAVIGSLFRRWISYAVLVSMGGYVAVFALSLLCGWRGWGQPPLWATGIALAVGGIPALFTPRPFLILFTSIPGAVNVMLGVFYFVGLPGLAEYSRPEYFFQDTYAAMFAPFSLPQIEAIVVLAVMSMFIQDRWTSRPMDDEITSAAFDADSRPI
jgi:hypothetical protein